MLRRLLYVLLGLIGLAAVAYALGPRPHFPEAREATPLVNYASPEADPARDDAGSAWAFAKTVSAQEQQLVEGGRVRPQSVARVELASGAPRFDSVSGRTPVAMVYLHGFSASPPEGMPLVSELARRYGANLYYARLSDHGLTGDESYADADPERWRAEAAQALAQARSHLGDSIVVVATSTGATLALDLAARFRESVQGLVLYSPNVQLAAPGASLLNGPWGLHLVRALAGGEYRQLEGIPEECDYIWTLRYRAEGIVALQELIERTMTQETFAAVQAPTLMAYWPDDDVISPEAAAAAAEQLGTPDAQVWVRPIPEVSGHVITTDCRTTGLEVVRATTQDFLEQVLGLQPVAR